jgi:hypothetical protein
MFTGLMIGKCLGQDGGCFSRNTKGVSLGTRLVVSDSSKAFNTLEDFSQANFSREAMKEVENSFFVTHGVISGR